MYSDISEQRYCEIEELNIQEYHVHVIVMVPPQVSLSELMGRLKGRSAIRILKQFAEFREKS